MLNKKKVIVTGGAGFIGSHAVVSLIDEGYEPIIIDSLINSNKSVIDNIELITGTKLNFFQVDIRDKYKLIDIFSSFEIDSVIHFAGLKSVNNSIHNPLEYYSCNIYGTLSLLEAMEFCDIKKLVFSSSATVYGEPEYLPIDENHPLKPTNPYGNSKLHIECILSDLCASSPSWSIVCLRYFNPIGAHKSGLIGENPIGIPENLMPYILKVASGELKVLNIYGDDYDTPDGTCLRDFIHIQDLVHAHIKSLEYSKSGKNFNVFNIGTGNAYSVLDLIKAFEKTVNIKINYSIAPRRKGDISLVYADTKLSNKELQWNASESINSMCYSAWKYILTNK